MWKRCCVDSTTTSDHICLDLGLLAEGVVSKTYLSCWCCWRASNHETG